METIELDLAAADHQAFGPGYDRPENLGDKCELVRGGVLRLPPHPEWIGNLTDWEADPFSDRNWKFQHHTLRWINPLRWAALDGDATARDLWVKIAHSWVNDNIPAEKSPSPFSWKDMADGNRAIQLSLGARMIGAQDRDWYLSALCYHRDWLLNEQHIVGKNHGLHQHAGLLVVGAVLGDREAMSVAHARMVEQFKATFDPQGGNDEGSTAYHQMNLRWWSQSWKRAELEGMHVPETVSHRRAAAGLALAHMAQPDGRLPQIGDSASGGVRVGMGDVADFAATRGKRGQKPGATTLVLDRGYVMSRSGWGEKRPIVQESHMLLRFGEDLRAHSHEDRGSLHIYARGRAWLVDSGFHSYQTGDPTREYLHSRQAHNIAELLGVPHRDSDPTELTRQVVSDEVHDFLILDRGYNQAALQRRVTYLVGPDCWIVTDSAETSKNLTLRQRWHVDAGVTVARHDRGYELRDGNSSLAMTWLGRMPQVRRHQAVEGDQRGWVGKRWKTKEPGTLITADAMGKNPALMALIAPSAPQEIGVVRSYLTTTGILDAVFMRGPKVWRIRMDEDVVRVIEQKRSW